MLGHTMHGPISIAMQYLLQSVSENLFLQHCEVTYTHSRQGLDLSVRMHSNAGTELARELKMAYSFVCEFVEFRSPSRDAKSQGGGIHGNAILSHLPLSDVEVIEHSHHPVDWNESDNYFSQYASLLFHDAKRSYEPSGDCVRALSRVLSSLLVPPFMQYSYNQPPRVGMQ